MWDYKPSHVRWDSCHRGATVIILTEECEWRKNTNEKVQRVKKKRLFWRRCDSPRAALVQKHFLVVGVALKSPRQSLFRFKDAACKLIPDMLQRARARGRFLAAVVFSYNLSKFHIRTSAVESELWYLRFRACFSLCWKKRESEREEKKKSPSEMMWEIFSPHAGLENQRSRQCPPTSESQEFKFTSLSPL